MVEKLFQSMMFHFLRVALSAGFLLFPILCSAQENPGPENDGLKMDAEGCEDLSVLGKLPGSIITSCHGGDSFEISVPLAPDAQGHSREKRVRGSYEFRSYQVLQTDQQDQAYDNLMQLLPIAGFLVKYTEKPETITARKENIWILVHLRGEYYDVTAVNSKEEPWAPATDAGGISREMQTNYRAAVYGIQFSNDNQTVSEENSKILPEVLNYLKANPDLAVVVESHKMSEDGNAKEDQEITEKRAKAVVSWLQAHDIPRKRLQPKGLGRTKPISENDTPLEIQRNERIELARAKS